MKIRTCILPCCFLSTDLKYLPVTRRMTSLPNTSLPAKPRASHHKYLLLPTKVRLLFPKKYPSNPYLIKNCTMKPSLDHQYWVDDLHFESVVIFIIKKIKESFLSSKDIYNLKQFNETYSSMILDIERLHHLDLSALKNPRLYYATQECICQNIGST